MKILFGVLNCCLLICLPAILPLQVRAQQNKSSKGSASTSFSGISKGNSIKSWWLTGPFAMDTLAGQTLADQEKFFDHEDVKALHFTQGKPVAGPAAGKAITWRHYNAKDDIIDLDSIFHKADYAAAYAATEVVADSAFPALLAIGSDDGVKVWLNGKLVHRNWTSRGVVADEDIVPVTLVKGSNCLLIKVQDMQEGWGFTARFLDQASLTHRLVTACGDGKSDDVDMLLAHGAAINDKDASGLSPLNAARLHGRYEIATLLLQKGAKEFPMPSATVMIDGLYASLKDKPYPGIAVLVEKDGKVLYKKAFGYADLENKALINTETKFRIGSITKQFTASAILKLQEEGRLKVTDKLSKYIPDFPRGDEVTLHHLLTHTSGIHSFTDKDDFFSKVTSPVKTEDLVNSIKKDTFDFNPGEQWRYNNSGYFLLGYIIEKVTGKSYGQYLQENFFGPLQMTNTGVHTSLLKLTNEAKGYTKNNGVYERALNWDMSWAGGAGILYSTVEDLAKWNEAVFDGKVLSEQSLKAAFTSVVLNNGKKPEGTEYGYGWGIGKYRGVETIQHSGGLQGFLSQLARYPAEHLTVTMLTNEAPAQQMVNPNTIAEFYLYDKMDKQPSYIVNTLPQQDVKIYEGRYDFQHSAVMIITSEGNNLFAQLSGQPKFPIFPSAPDEFFWKVVEARIKFKRNEKGEVTGSDFYQNGAHIEAPRLQEEVIVAVDTALYKNYIGDYNLGDNVIISVSTAKGKLYARAKGEEQYEIFPVSDTTFILKELNARVTFIREPGGLVNKMILDMAGQKKDAPKINK